MDKNLLIHNNCLTLAIAVSLGVPALLLPSGFGLQLCRLACSVMLFLVGRNVLGIFGDRTDLGGWVTARIFIWWQRHGATFLTPDNSAVVQVENHMSSWIATYSSFFYHCMTEDVLRMASFRAAAASAGEACKDMSEASLPVWIDVGCGQHFPLTRMVLDSGAARHVHAIEANARAYPEIEKHLKHEPKYSNKITLHKCYGSDVKFPEGMRADALIHELIGVIASDEGMMQIIADVEDRLLKPNACVIPSYIATTAVPVGPPWMSAVSTMANMTFPAADVFLRREPGIYNVYGRMDTVRLCDSPLAVEEFFFGTEKGAKPAKEQMQQHNVVSWTATQASTFSGILLSCIFRGDPDAPPCDALVNRTSWGQNFIRLARVGEEVPVTVGDVISLAFDVDARTISPFYNVVVKVIHNDQEVASYKHEWQGPIGQSSLFPCL